MKCKNTTGSYYTGSEPSPKGLGLCASGYAVAESEGVQLKGKDGELWTLRKSTRKKTGVEYLTWRKVQNPDVKEPVGMNGTKASNNSNPLDLRTVPLDLSVFNTLSYTAGDYRSEAIIFDEPEEAVPEAIWKSVVTNLHRIILAVPSINHDRRYILQAVVLSGTGDNGAVTVGDVYDKYNNAARRLIEEMKYDSSGLYSDGSESMPILLVGNNRL